jgi:hypothetical protein
MFLARSEYKRVITGQSAIRKLIMDELIFDRVSELLDQGASERFIAACLGVANSTAHKYACLVRASRMDKSRTTEKVSDLKSNGASQVETARALGTTSRAAKTWIDKSVGTHTPVDNELRLELSKGTTLNRLKNKFGILTISEVESLAADVFQFPILVAKQPTEDAKDTVIIVIPDRSGQFDWIDKRKESQFKYFVNPENNYMYVQFDQDVPDNLKIYNLTDLHIGSNHCRTELLKQHIKMIEEDPAAFAFLGGDIFEHLHKLSVGQPWEQKIAPMEQVACAARMLMPIAHKIIRYAGGNHDRDRGYKYVGADLAQVLADMLRVPYSHIETVIDLNHKGQIFTAILHHGSGSGRSVNTILQDAEKYRSHCTFFTHWHLSGHVHQAMVHPRYATRRIIGKGLVPERFYTVIGGSYMVRTGTYAEETKYPPTAQDLTFIEFNADGTYDAGCVKIDPK